jgi:hypothetical protein
MRVERSDRGSARVIGKAFENGTVIGKVELSVKGPEIKNNA